MAFHPTNGTTPQFDTRHGTRVTFAQPPSEPVPPLRPSAPAAPHHPVGPARPVPESRGPSRTALIATAAVAAVAVGAVGWRMWSWRRCAAERARFHAQVRHEQDAALRAEGPPAPEHPQLGADDAATVLLLRHVAEGNATAVDADLRCGADATRHRHIALHCAVCRALCIAVSPPTGRGRTDTRHRATLAAALGICRALMWSGADIASPVSFEDVTLRLLRLALPGSDCLVTALGAPALPPLHRGVAACLLSILTDTALARCPLEAAAQIAAATDAGNALEAMLLATRDETLRRNAVACCLRHAAQPPAPFDLDARVLALSDTSLTDILCGGSDATLALLARGGLLPAAPVDPPEPLCRTRDAFFERTQAALLATVAAAGANFDAGAMATSAVGAAVPRPRPLRVLCARVCGAAEPAAIAGAVHTAAVAASEPFATDEEGNTALHALLLPLTHMDTMQAPLGGDVQRALVACVQSLLAPAVLSRARCPELAPSAPQRSGSTASDGRSTEHSHGSTPRSTGPGPTSQQWVRVEDTLDARRRAVVAMPNATGQTPYLLAASVPELRDVAGALASLEYELC